MVTCLVEFHRVRGFLLNRACGSSCGFDEFGTIAWAMQVSATSGTPASAYRLWDSSRDHDPMCV
jgi:hypothetical protein